MEVRIRMLENIPAIKTPFYVILAVLLSAFLFTACLSKTRLTGSSIDNEAKKEAEQFWFSQITKCGDSYYREIQYKQKDVVFYEYKEPSVHVASATVTEADRMNGIEWQGRISLESKLSRIWGSDLGHWQQWSNGLGDTRDNSYRMKKVKGQWNINTDRGKIFEEVSQYVPVDCSKIPQQ